MYTHPLTVEEIAEVRKHLTSARDRALFTLGVNTAFRGGDILSLNVGDVRNVTIGGCVRLIEQKTNKRRSIVLNSVVHKVLQELLEERADAPDDAPLFVGEKRGTRLTVCTLSRLWKAWAAAAGIEKNVASHSGRKSAARAWYDNGVKLAQIAIALNHSSEAVTMRYLGITQEDLNEMYMNHVV